MSAYSFPRQPPCSADLAASGGPGRRALEGRGRAVALTGASSFLGKNLVAVLEEDPTIDRIIALDVKKPETGGAKTRLYEIDLTSASSEERIAEILGAERIDTLVHMAFLSSPSPAVGWAHELESVGTMHLLHAIRKVNLHKLVLWSQTILYGAHPTNPNFLTEKHPLRASRSTPFFGDKIQVEADVVAFAAKARKTVVTVLRTAPILGPTVKNYVSRYLDRRVVWTLLGFDPLWQFLHEVDAIAAFKLAVDEDFPGTFNIVGDGVLPLSTIIRLAGRTRVPVAHSIADPLVAAFWTAQLSEAPASFLRYLRYVCVADGEKARRVMGLSPAYSTREALLDYISAQRLRDAKLLQESPA